MTIPALGSSGLARTCRPPPADAPPAGPGERNDLADHRLRSTPAIVGAETQTMTSPLRSARRAAPCREIEGERKRAHQAATFGPCSRPAARGPSPKARAQKCALAPAAATQHRLWRMPPSAASTISASRPAFLISAQRPRSGAGGPGRAGSRGPDRCRAASRILRAGRRKADRRFSRARRRPRRRSCANFGRAGRLAFFRRAR